MSVTVANFSVGQLVYHKMFDYRGVVIDVDPCFEGDDDWYEEIANSRPPKDKPWYHVLVHNAVHRTYVAECNLVPDNRGAPIDHPEVEAFFVALADGYYRLRVESN